MSLVKEKKLKKLVLVLATSILVTTTSKKDLILDHILYIYYLVYFWKGRNYIKTLIDLDSKINIITLIYTLKLGFQV